MIKPIGIFYDPSKQKHQEVVLKSDILTKCFKDGMCPDESEAYWEYYQKNVGVLCVNDMITDEAIQDILKDENSGDQSK